MRPQPAFQADARAVGAADVLRVAGVGVLLVDGGAPSSVALASDASVYRLCALEADGVPGPATASVTSGESVRCAGPDGDGAWPDYTGFLHAAGYRGAIAIPVDGAEHVSGVLLLCQKHVVALSPMRERLAAVLATLLVETAVRAQAIRRLQATIDALGATMRRIDQEVLTHDNAARR